VTVKLVINTVTTGDDRMPVPRESRQRAKVLLNSQDDTFIVEVDKPKPGERIDSDAWKGFLEPRMGYIKYLIDNKIVTPRDDNDSERMTQKILDFFHYYRGR
jgi:hypothetical protein